MLAQIFQRFFAVQFSFSGQVASEAVVRCCVCQWLVGGQSANSLRRLPRSALLPMGSPIEFSLNRHVSLGTAKPTECDRSDTEKGCYQGMAEEAFVAREIFAKPRKAVSAAKCRKAPLSTSLTGQFLLQNVVCPFANGL